MTIADNKLEISIVAMVVLMAAGVFHVMTSIKGQGSLERDIVYEMPRPKGFQGSDLDLSDREIDREYVNPFVKREKLAPIAANQKPAPVAAKKAVDAAKKKAEADAAAKKAAQVTARVVPKDAAKPLGSDSTAKTDQAYAPPGNAYGNPQENNEPNGADKKKDDNKLSPDQWRALVVGQPTAENMEKLIAARTSGEVDSATYNTIIGDLLKSSNPTTQEVGLTGAKAFPDAGSFIVVAQNEEHLSGNELVTAKTFLSSYTQGNGLNALATVLQSNDDAVVAQATEVIVAGYQSVKKGTPISTPDPRNGRGTVTTSSTASYQKFIAIFQQLAKSSDSNIASLANSALAQIQAA